MGCPSEVEIGDNLVFTVTTHSFSTGAAADADSVPSYRVYEDETGTAILTGSMAKLDDANTTGFYSELIACTSGNGFENGKSYTVYIEATVSSVVGAVSYGFKAYDRRKADAVAISGSLTAADLLEIMAQLSVPIIVGASASTTSIPSDLGGTYNSNAFVNRQLAMSSGGVIKEFSTITGYDGATGEFTVQGFTDAPAENDLGIVI